MPLNSDSRKERRIVGLILDQGEITNDASVAGCDAERDPLRFAMLFADSHGERSTGLRPVPSGGVESTHLSLIVIFAFSLSAFGPAQVEARSDEATLSAIAEEYFAAHARKDLETFVRLWSAASPDFAARKKRVQDLFATTERIDVDPLSVLKTMTEGEKPSLSVSLDLNAIDATTHQLKRGFGKINRTLYFVSEGGAWKIWRDVGVEEELAEAFIAAKTESEKSALLSKERDFVTPRFVQAMYTQGDRLRVKGEYPQTLAIYDLAEGIAKQIDDKSGIADLLIGRGLVNMAQGNFDQALEQFEKSLTFRGTAEGDPSGITTALGNIGSVHTWQANYVLALEYFQKQLTMDEARGDRVGMGFALNNIGHIHRLQGNYSLAMSFFQKSLKLREPLGDNVSTANTLLNIGIVHSVQNNYMLAEEFYQRGLELRQASGNKAGIALTLNSMGLLDYFQGHYELALEDYQKSLTLREELGDKPGIAQTLNNMASALYAQGKYTQALEAAERALTIARQANLRDTIWRSLIPAGKSSRALNRPAQARQAFDEAITTIEALRAQVGGGAQTEQRFFEDKLAPYYEMAGLLIAENKINEAFAYSERAKARVLLDVLRSGRVNVTKAMTAEEQEHERRLKSDLISLNTQISRENARPQPDQTRVADLKGRVEKARLAFETSQAGVYASHPELRVHRGDFQSISADEAGLLLDAKSAVLEYVVTADETFLFVLTKSTKNPPAEAGATSLTVDLRAHRLGVNRKTLAERTGRFREQLARRDLDFAGPARELHDLLIGPAREQLQGKTTLVIVPDAVLWELPFQALRTAQNRYLIEDQSVSYAPSLTVLREMMKVRTRSTAASSATLLAFGNPSLGKQTVERAKLVMMDEKLDPLPEAEKQVRTLGRLYGAAKSRIYVGARASEERVKAEAGQYRILQLATHGILNDANPMYSHVVLAAGEGERREDGLLEAWEIMNLDLKADMVVLSACETARGRVVAGEGVIGLSWALFVAGSPTTVVSQWKVESASTTQLMLGFHRNLQSGKSPVSTAKALQQAAKTMLESSEYRHPFYWAGFVIVGDGR